MIVVTFLLDDFKDTKKFKWSKSTFDDVVEYIQSVYDLEG